MKTKSKQIWRVAGLSVLALVLALVLHLRLVSGSLMQNIGGWVLLVLWLIASVLLLQKKSGSEKNVPASGIQKIRALKKTVDRTPPKAFKKEMRTLESQVDRLMSRDEALEKSLKNHFGDTSITTGKFLNTVNQVENLFITNSQKILERINLFDQEGYQNIFARHQEYTSAVVPYNEAFAFVDRKLNENEKILQKLDRLALEVTGLHESTTPIDQLPAMQEINELIEQTKLYRQN